MKKIKFGNIGPWFGAIVLVAAGGYYFLKIRPKQQEHAMAPVMPAPSNVANQAIENIGSRRVRAYHSNRLPKIKKARTV